MSTLSQVIAHIWQLHAQVRVLLNSFIKSLDGILDYPSLHIIFHWFFQVFDQKTGLYWDILPLLLASAWVRLRFGFRTLWVLGYHWESCFLILKSFFFAGIIAMPSSSDLTFEIKNLVLTDSKWLAELYLMYSSIILFMIQALSGRLKINKKSIYN